MINSADAETFEIDEIVALESQAIKNMIEDECADNVIPLNNITSETLSKVIENCKKHAESPVRPYRSGTSSKIIEYCKKHAESPKKYDNADIDEKAVEDLKSFDAEFAKNDMTLIKDIIIVSVFFIK